MALDNTEDSHFEFDDSGKIDLNFIYNEPSPIAYYSTLSRLDYRIPAVAEPLFRTVITALRRSRGKRDVTLLDVGSSYGVNSALLRSRLDLSDLNDAYGRRRTAGLDRKGLIARDRRMLAEAREDKALSVVALDTADKAIAYAEAAGYAEAGITTDLESLDPEPTDARLLSEVDLVISTGAIGYVGEATFSRILNCCRQPPWFALFALRMFPFDEIAATLKAHGQQPYRLAGRTFQQRRFANEEEEEHVLDRLAALDIDPVGKEAEGWYHAQFFFSRPAEEDGPLPLPGLVAI